MRMHITRWMLAGVVVAALAGCSKKESPEEAIRKVLDEGAAALEARDAPRAAKTLAESYADGNKRDKQKLKALAFVALQQGPVLVSMQNVVIDVKSDAAADVKLKVLAVQGSPELKTAKDLLPTNARAFDLDIRMVKVDGEWQVDAIDGIGGTGAWE